MKKEFDIKRRLDSLSRGEVLFSYIGPLSLTEMDNILLDVEQSLENFCTSRLELKRINNILIESLQNVYRYMKYQVKKDLAVLALISKNDMAYQITTGNYLLKTDVIDIQSRLEILNSMDGKQIRDMYRGVLDTGERSKGGGAGLGFIDMARRSSGILKSEFEPIDKEYSFFTLQLNVDIEN